MYTYFNPNSIADFKKWFTGFAAACGNQPTPEQWEALKTEIGKLNEYTFTSGGPSTPVLTTTGGPNTIVSLQDGPSAADCAAYAFSGFKAVEKGTSGTAADIADSMINGSANCEH